MTRMVTGLPMPMKNWSATPDPNNPYSNLDGILDGWEILLGLNPQTDNLTQPGERANYTYTLADWLNGVSGIKSGTISLDNEGNVLTVSQ